jgi:hypothetical protein
MTSETMATGELTAVIAAGLERQLEIAEQITHIGSWEWRLADGRLTWSDELYRIYGEVPRARQVTFEWFMGRIHPEDRQRVQAAVERALVRGGRYPPRPRLCHL